MALSFSIGINFICQEKTYLTRQEQLNMKPDRGGRGRGRGKGRGRGRGNKAGAGSVDSSKQKQSKTTKGSKTKNAQQDDDDWWNQAWTKEYGHPDESWGHEDWGSEGWSWDEYAWWEGQHALQDMGQDNDKKRMKQDKGGPEEPPKKKTKEKKTEKTETETPSAASAEPPKKKPKKDKNGKEEVEINSAQLKKDKKKIQQFIALFPAHAGKKNKIISDGLKEEMRSHLLLSELVECRLNIYWTRPACGVHSRSLKCDLATFAIPDPDGSFPVVSRLAAAVKCGELFVTRLQLHVVNRKHLRPTK